MGKSQHLLALLSKLELALTALNLWQQQRPNKEALNSRQPFCLDTLTFSQWLQFVFIEKIQEMIASNMPLPTQVLISPMAEEAFKGMGDEAADIINTLADIDQLLSGKKEQNRYDR